MELADKQTREQIENRILKVSFVMSCVLSLAEVAAAIILRSHTVFMDAIFDSADLIQTGRKTWIGVYLKGRDDAAMIDTREWSVLRERVEAALEDEFDQLYVEFIPDLPEQ